MRRRYADSQTRDLAAKAEPDLRSRISDAPQECCIACGMTGACLAHQAFDVFPVHEIVEPGFEVLLPGVAVIDVITVLPDIAAEDRL
jgi:fatty acid/phospholipid biosynthesis enzyme